MILESPGAAHASSSARLEFGLARAYDQDVQRAGFECQLQMFSARLGYYEWASWDACRSPLTLDGLRDGAYRFRVRSASAGGRDTPAAAAELDFAVRDAPSDALRLPGWGQPGAVGRHPLQVHCCSVLCLACSPYAGGLTLRHFAPPPPTPPKNKAWMHPSATVS